MKSPFARINILNKYDVYIGRDLISQIPTWFNLDSYSKVVVITDQQLEKILLDKVIEEISPNINKVIVPVGEKAKHIETVVQIWKELLELGCDRKSLIINLGGGVIGDMGGFAAATYMRGIDFLQIPTTLLAQVDASVGSKVGINLNEVKNLIGSFSEPIGVVIDTQLLKTLPKREFIEGFGEIIKTGLIYDKSFYEKVTAKKPTDFSSEEILEIVERSIEIKAEVVNADATEQGSRRILNFGHTIGHAFESFSQKLEKPLLHGEAISIGMVVEVEISQLLGMISKADVLEIKKKLTSAGLLDNLPKFEPSDILQLIKHDKKSEKGVIKWTLLEKIGKAIFDQKVDDKIVKEALSIF